MNEVEKMLNGFIYNPYCKELQELRTKTHLLCEKYNKTTEKNTKKREKILNELLPNKGENVYLQGPIYFNFGKYISIGNNTYANFNFTVLDTCKVTIGNNVLIGPNVSLLTPLHPLCYEDREKYEINGNITAKEYGASITIEDNCWIAGNVTVCGGVTIKEGSVIGAGSVVTKDIPPHSLAFGNPCKVYRKITEEDRLSNHPELFSKE